MMIMVMMNIIVVLFVDSIYGIVYDDDDRSFYDYQCDDDDDDNYYPSICIMFFIDFRE